MAGRGVVAGGGCTVLEGRGVFIFGVQEVDSIWLVCGVIDVCVFGV